QLETGAATTATVLIDCLFLFLIPGTMMHLIPVMAVGKVYSNSFLYLLNSRNVYRRTTTSNRLGTADFARSLDRSSNPSDGGTARNPASRGSSNVKGVRALQFAPNTSALESTAVHTNIEVRWSILLYCADELTGLFLSIIFGSSLNIIDYGGC
ncbi:hypothetical protein DL93DRAFT_2078139, partial [Clavulina sp. PMI_390]